MGAYSGVLLSYPLEYPVTIDGKWTTEREWSDADQMRLLPAIGYFIGNNSMAYVDVRVCLKHDEKNLYVLVDFISDNSSEPGSPSDPDMVSFYLDTLGNGGNNLQQDDVVAVIEWTIVNHVNAFVLKFLEVAAQGEVNWDLYGVRMVEAAPPEGMQAAASSDASNDKFSSSRHAIYEIEIPRSIFKGPNDPAISIRVQDHGSANPKDCKQAIFADFPHREPNGDLRPNYFSRIQFLKAPRLWQYNALSSLNTVHIDGIWTTPDEWADAVEEPLVCIQGDGRGFLKAKFDSSMLYLLGDFLSDTTADYNLPSDPSGARLSVELSGHEYALSVTWRKGKPEFTVMNGSSGAAESEPRDRSLFLAASQFDGGHDPYSKKTHAVYEFGIGRNLVGNSTIIRLRLGMWDWVSGTSLHWPPFRIFPSEAGLLFIVPPMLNASAYSSRLEMQVGESLGLPIVLTATNNFQGTVEVHASASGQNLVVSLSPRSVTMPINGKERVELTVQADQNAGPGVYDLIISATGNGVACSLKLAVEVKSAPLSETALQVKNPSPISVEKGSAFLALMGVGVVAVLVLAVRGRKRAR